MSRHYTGKQVYEKSRAIYYKCFNCNGLGSVNIAPGFYGRRTCSHCKGTGIVEIDSKTIQYNSLG